MGHEGYLTEVYRRYSKENLAKLHKQGEHALLIFTEAGKLRPDRGKKQATPDINGLAIENVELKEKMKNVNDWLRNLERILKIEGTFTHVRGPLYAHRKPKKEATQ